MNLGDAAKELHRLVDGHIQHLADVLALILHLKGFAVVTLPIAVGAFDVNIGQKVHLNYPNASSFARFTTTSFHVKRKPACLKSTNLGIGCQLEQLADIGKYSGVGSRI